MRFVLAAAFLAAMSLSSLAEESKLEGVKETGTPQEIDKTLDSMVEVPLVRQNCWSARKCRGKILSHRDAHNCKRTGGKSWSSNTGKCYNL